MSGAQPASAREPSETFCATCATPLQGKFCAACGEKRVDPHEYSIGHFAEHALESFTHVDFKSFHTLKLLISRPGLLTREYLDGRRRPYVNPLQLFVIVNLLFALLIGLSGWTPLNTPMNVKQNIGPMRVFAGLSAALYSFRRYFFGHLIFATHFYTFVLAYFLVATHLSTWVLKGFASFGVRFDPNNIDNTVSLIMLFVLGWYLYKALRRTYDDSRPRAFARSFVLTIAFFPILLLYRLLLFFATIKAMH